MSKKILFLGCCSLFLVNLLQAQTIQYGLKAGINFASISAYDNPTSSYYQSKNFGNVRFGGIVEYSRQKFAIQSGLILDGKGGVNTYINTESNTNRRKNARLYYLEIPVNFLYGVPIKAGTLFFGGGAYAAYGIAGNYSLSGIIFDSPIDGTEKVYFGNNENSDYKRTDFGANFRAEIRFLHGIGLELNYEYGLKNIATPSLYDDVGIKTRNKVFGIAVSFLINNH